MTPDPQLAPLFLDEAAAAEARRTGTKAATLARLLARGANVPPGFVVPAEVCARIAGEPERWRATLRPVVGAALERIGGGAVAVRSSALAEDRGDASFAGMYETVLDVRGAEMVCAAIERVVASAGNARATAYAHDHGLAVGNGLDPAVAAGMAVLVQSLVPATAAGVAFTANPVTGNRQECLVSAVRGLGEALVGGEETPEEWIVTGETAERQEQAGAPSDVLEAADASRIARIAGQLAEELQTPLDVEWALADGVVHLLQARPITALPVAPAIDPPPGIWMKDTAHFPEPVTPFGASVYVSLFDQAIRDMCDSWGLMLEVVQSRVIGHEVYTRAVPFGGGSETAPAPPWWVLAVVTRLLPALRRRLAIGERVLAAGLLESVPREWEEEGREALVAELRTLTAVDVAGLDDGALWRHFDEIRDFAARAQRIHFRLFVPYVLGLHDLCTTTHQLLGWDEARTMGLLQGLSVASSAPTRALDDLANVLRARPPGREALTAPDALERLPEFDPEAAAAVGAYLAEWGLRTLGYDPGSSSLAERLDMFAALLGDAVAAETAGVELETRRQEAIAGARAALDDPGSAARARFDRALAAAEVVYPQREDNILLTDGLPAGLLRRAGRELGRRLVAAGRLARAEDFALLTSEELRRNEGLDLGALVARRAAELAWVRAHPGPVRYGPEPPPPPDVRGLPPAARRLMGGLLWIMDLELRPAAPAAGELRGQGVSAGIYRGRVRVIRRVEDLDRLQRGEILVCPVTTPAWSVVFGQAGALITDGGSVLSHAAIIAREHGIPGIVATGDATCRLHDGMEVTVDGTAGSVRIESPSAG